MSTEDAAASSSAIDPTPVVWEMPASSMSTEDAAKAAWLAKLAAPSWGAKLAAAAPAAAPASDDEQTPLKEAAGPRTPPSLESSFDAEAKRPTNTFVASSADEAAARAPVVWGVPEPLLDNAETAKVAWLSENAPAWESSKAAAARAAVAPDAVTVEDAATAAWLAKLDTPSWGAKAAAAAGSVAEVTPDVAAPAMSEADAKAAWLQKIDVPAWGPRRDQAASLLTQLWEEGEQLIQAATPGSAPASNTAPSADAAALEEAAKATWLAKLDTPSWTAKLDNPDSAPVLWGMPPSLLTRAEAAKVAWLAKLENPTWGAKAADPTVASATDSAPVLWGMSPSLLTKEDAAKAAWLAKLETPPWGPKGGATAAAPDAPAPATIEEKAKAAWLSRLETPPWGLKAEAEPEPEAATSPKGQRSQRGKVAQSFVKDFVMPAAEAARLDFILPLASEAAAVQPPPPPLSRTAAAEEAWHKKLREPEATWGNAPQSAGAWTQPPRTTSDRSDIKYRVVGQLSDEDAAKQAWLGRLNP